MDKFTNFARLGLACTLMLAIIIVPVNGQSTALCTGAMINNFTPCISFLMSGSNRSSPSSDCCDSLKSLMSNGQDCFCLIITGGAGLQIPINQTLAMSLPRSCRTSGVPVECKATSASPVPSTGQNGSNPGLFSPPSAGSFVPQSPPTPSLTPEGITTPGAIVPTLTPPGMRPTLTLSAAHPSHSALPSFLATVLGVIILNCY